MANTDIALTIISVLGTVSSILFAFLAFRRNDKKDTKENGKNEGVILSEIGYIKSSIDRMESKLNKVESNYYSMLERIIKVEQNQRALEKRFNDYIEGHSNN